jgi:oligopeptide/dipeptide ABC transporter ATP-binding protein
MSDMPLLELQELEVTFAGSRRRPPLRAVADVNFEVPSGRTVALVGESGSGKSTIGNAILGMVRPSSGKVYFRGELLVDEHFVDRERISRHVQVVFQDPYGSLNPSRTIGQTMVEPLIVKSRGFDGDRGRAVVEALEQVGLPASAADRYPSEFSGGQRQRIAIARAMITSPELVICDEPVSSLDLSVQAQILNLLAEQQRARQLSYLFISHDLAVVRRVADDIVILYRGRVVERGVASEVIKRPHHPYTVSLLSAAPVPDPALQRARREARRVFTARSASTESASAGCPFATRCPLALELCVRERPELLPTVTGTLAACHRASEVGDGQLNEVASLASEV